MKINGNAIRVGMVIEHKGSLWRATKIQHVKPGKGGAYMQAELKDIKTGTKLNERFRASETVERARLEQNNYQYLFADGDMYTFMDMESYEQVGLSADLIGDGTAFLQEGMTVILEMHESGPIGIQLPEIVVLEVTDTEPVVKGQTAASSNKPAKLENGLRVMVPPFVGVGDRIQVSTGDATYYKRAD